MNKRIYHILSGRFGTRLEIRMLMWQTARAFEVHMPGTTGLSAEELLAGYAGFSADITLQAIRTEQNLELLREKLYCRAYRLGSILRRFMKPKDEQETFTLLSLLYRNIGITITAEDPGEFCVHKCYFSDFYTADICAVISALDEGIFSGLYGGEILQFNERITDGHDECIAEFKRQQGDRCGN